MLHKKLRLPKHNVTNLLQSIGRNEDIFEIIDLNKDKPEGKKQFSQLISRCDNIDKKITKILKICEEFELNNNNFSDYDQFKFYSENFEKEAIKKDKIPFDCIDYELTKMEKNIEELYTNLNILEEELESLYEKKEVWTIMKTLLLDKSENILNQFNQDDRFEDNEQNSGFKIISGIVSSENLIKMKRMIFRVSKGRAVLHSYLLGHNDHLEVKHKEKLETKRIFIILFTGSTEGFLYKKIIKVCDIFNSSRYIVPVLNEFNILYPQLESDINQKQSILKESKSSLDNLLKDALKSNESEPSRIEFFRIYIKNERYIYSNLNKCVVTENFVDVEIFIPESKVELLKKIIETCLVHSDNENSPTYQLTDIKNSNLKFPTYIPTTEFTWTFQEIVNTYGIPRYKEFNPAVFNIITFPFLFGVMFGDIAHGLFLFVFGMYLVLNNNLLSKSDSLIKILLPGRFLFALMGFFALYCGFLYNDLASISLPLGYSCWNPIGDDKTAKIKNCDYYFGIDHTWNSSSNDLSFMNSLKMKLSVILGVTHMMLGIVVKGINLVYFDDKLSFFAEFLPQITFMFLIFGYMDIMIIIKWLRNWDKFEYLAPNITSTLLNLFLGLGKVEGDYTQNEKAHLDPSYIPSNPVRALYGDEKGELQSLIQLILLIIAVLCIPIVLLVKPIVLNNRKKKKIDNSPAISLSSKLVHSESSGEKEKHLLINEEEDDNMIKDRKDLHNEHDEESFGDLLMHQTIETIEFVLGSISNTASYLRLWALSLAHSQLSKVFYEKALKGAIVYDYENNVTFVLILLTFIKVRIFYI